MYTVYYGSEARAPAAAACAQAHSLVCEEHVLDAAHLRDALGQHGVEAGGVHQHVALWARDEEALTTKRLLGAPGAVAASMAQPAGAHLSAVSMS